MFVYQRVSHNFSDGRIDFLCLQWDDHQKRPKKERRGALSSELLGAELGKIGVIVLTTERSSHFWMFYIYIYYLYIYIILSIDIYVYYMYSNPTNHSLVAWWLQKVLLLSNWEDHHYELPP